MREAVGNLVRDMQDDHSMSSALAEDVDLDRVISDPAYRRRVIARLNARDDDEVADERDAAVEETALGEHLHQV